MPEPEETKTETTTTPTDESTDTSTEQIPADERASADEMDSMFNELNEIEVPEPKAKPAESKEGDDQDPKPAPAKEDAKAELEVKEPGADKDATAAADATKNKKDAEKEGDDKPKDPDPLDIEYDVLVDAQVRQVKAKDLVTTYQQYPALQRAYLNVKPALDLLKQNRAPDQMLMPLLELGIRTAYAQQTGSAATPMTGQSQQYDGPFKDADEDAHVKDNDPVFYNTQWKQWRAIQDSRSRMAAPVRTPEHQTGPSPEAKQLFDKIVASVNSWAGDQHKDYFEAKTQDGNTRMHHFLNHISRYYGQLDPSQLTPTMLSAAFATFDEKYVQEFMARQSAEETKRLKAEDRALHSESGSVRDSAPVTLTDDQKEMADMFDL